MIKTCGIHGATVPLLLIELLCFEDNAEYGLGIVLSKNHRRATLTEVVENAIKAKVGSTEIWEALAEWLKGVKNCKVC